MTEETGNFINLSMTVGLMSLLIAVVLNLMMATQSIWVSWSNNMVLMLQSVESKALVDMDGKSGVSAPMLYKACETNSDAITYFSVTFLDNHSTNDYNELLKRSYALLKITVVETNSKYTINATEVAR